MRLSDIDTESTHKTLYVAVCERYFYGFHQHAYIEPQSVTTDQYEAYRLANSFSLTDNDSYIVVYYNRYRKRWQKL